MRSEDDKAEVELKVFSEFSTAAKLDIQPDTIKKGSATDGEPDIYCEVNGYPVYFELTEACAPEFAAAITKSIKTEEPEAVWGSDVSVQTILGKLSKTYDVSAPIELVLYTAGRTVLPDDVIAAKVERVLGNGLGPFTKVWLFGDQAKCIASNS